MLQALKSVGEEVLKNAGKISHKKAMKKAEKDYIETLEELKIIEKKRK